MSSIARCSPWAILQRVLVCVWLGAGTLNAQEPATHNSVTNDVATNAIVMKPLWEVGVFAGAARFPHYRGSDEHKVYVLPLPFFIYRGEILQADRDGVRGLFYRSEKVETTLSLSGNPPVDDDNDAREGMPELMALGEAGPAIKYFLYRNPVSSSFYLHAAVRGVVAADIEEWETHYEGVHGGLSLVLAHYRPKPGGPWSFGCATSLDFSDARYNGYFYDVDEAYVLPEREYYQAGGGYGGLSVSVNTSRRMTPTLVWGLYARWDSVNGAVYEESPLVREDNSYIIGAALAWTFRQSNERVRTHDE